MRHGPFDDATQEDVLDRPNPSPTRDRLVGRQDLLGALAQTGGTGTSNAPLRRLTLDRTNNLPRGVGRR